MAATKTTQTEASVASFLNKVADLQQRADAFRVLEMMKEITGQPPKMWGPSIVGFGEYHYVYDSGREGDTCLTGFSPRKDALVLYFTAGLQERFADRIHKLGKVKASKGCLYIKRLDDIDVDALRDMIRENVAYLSNISNEPSKQAATRKKPKKRRVNEVSRGGAHPR
jgi:hypothetical protein